MKNSVKTVEKLASEMGALDGITIDTYNYQEDGCVCVNVRIYYKGGRKNLADDLAESTKSNLETIGFDDVDIVRLMPNDNFVTVTGNSSNGEVRNNHVFINDELVCDLS